VNGSQTTSFKDSKVSSIMDKKRELTQIQSEKNANSKWDIVCNALIHTLGQATFESWIKRLRLVDITQSIVILSAPSNYIKQRVETDFYHAILNAWRVADNQISCLSFVVIPENLENTAAAHSPTVKTPAQAFQPEQQNTHTPVNVTNDLMTAPLDPRYTFDTFVLGKSNALAHAAAVRVSETDDSQINPLFIYGGVGLGKTHLMHAIAWRIQERDPKKRVVYVSAEQFLYRFVKALQKKDMMGFKEEFRNVDVLMVDDVQFIAGKDSTQEEFFHTFNALMDQSKQIIITSDQPPSELDKLEERIKSRLSWGLVVDVHSTDYELRLGILQSKAEQIAEVHPNIVFEGKVLEFLARKITSNVRVLEGALNRLVAYASLMNREINIDMAHELLQDVLRASDKKLTIEEIQRKVAEYYKIRMSDLHSPRRARSVARPRQLAMYLCKQLTSRSFPDIGKRFGGRDHTTVMHACVRIEELINTDSQLRDDVEMLRHLLEA
jgi:chromosomal replication initiator protein